jgi:predicted transcriptional regulator
MNIIMTRNKEDYNLRDVDVTKNRFGSAGQAVFEMTARGFDFQAVEDNSSQSNGKKLTKPELVKQAIADGSSTVAEICEKSGVSGAYLTNILRELVNQGSITKDGKGVDAKYNFKS